MYKIVEVMDDVLISFYDDLKYWSMITIAWMNKQIILRFQEVASNNYIYK